MKKKDDKWTQLFQSHEVYHRCALFQTRYLHITYDNIDEKTDISSYLQ